MFFTKFRTITFFYVSTKILFLRSRLSLKRFLWQIPVCVFAWKREFCPIDFQLLHTVSVFLYHCRQEKTRNGNCGIFHDNSRMEISCGKLWKEGIFSLFYSPEFKNKKLSRAKGKFLQKDIKLIERIATDGKFRSNWSKPL